MSIIDFDGVAAVSVSPHASAKSTHRSQSPGIHSQIRPELNIVAILAAIDAITGLPS